MHVERLSDASYRARISFPPFLWSSDIETLSIGPLDFVSQEQSTMELALEEASRLALTFISNMESAVESSNMGYQKFKEAYEDSDS